MSQCVHALKEKKWIRIYFFVSHPKIFKHFHWEKTLGSTYHLNYFLTTNVEVYDDTMWENVAFCQKDFRSVITRIFPVLCRVSQNQNSPPAPSTVRFIPRASLKSVVSVRFYMTPKNWPEVSFINFQHASWRFSTS